MRRWLQRLLQSSVLALGMMLSVPALASPSSDAGCASFEKTSDQTVSACVGSYTYNPGSLTPAIFHPNDTSNQSNQPVWTFGSTPVTSSQVVFNALQTFGQSACATTSAQGQLAPVSDTTTTPAVMHCWREKVPSDIGTNMQEIEQWLDNNLPFNSPSGVPVSTPGEYTAEAFGSSIPTDINDFLFPHHIVVCTDNPNYKKVKEDYFTLPASEVEQECQQSSSDSSAWICKSTAIQRKALTAEQKARNAKRKEDIKELEKSMNKHGEYRPGKGCDLHHIIPNDSPNLPEYEQARQIVKNECGDSFSLNDYENGVYLPGKEEGSACKGFYHKTLDKNQEYGEYLLEEIEKGSDDGCDGIKKALQKIKSYLESGEGRVFHPPAK